MIPCDACGRQMRAPYLTVNGQHFGPVCGRAMLVRKKRARRRDAGSRRGPRVDPRQIDWVGQTA